MPKVLTEEQVRTFREEGFLTELGPVYSAAEMKGLDVGMASLLALLEPGESSKEIREWHESSRFLYDICMHPAILDPVEDLLGSDFNLWASNFFIKEPRTSESVTWHQDAYYWPLEPIESLTVWLAIDDVDEENGAMEVIPGSHRDGIRPHNRIEGSADSVLALEAELGNMDPQSAVPICLSAGQFSIHDDQLLHGSPANPSARRRAGLTVRYSPTHVRNDQNVNEHFRVYLARGEDHYGHSPKGVVPEQRFGRLWRTHLSKDEAGTDDERRAR